MASTNDDAKTQPTQSYSNKFKEYINARLSPHALYESNSTPNSPVPNTNTNPEFQLGMDEKYGQFQKKLIVMEQKNNALQHKNKRLVIENNKLKSVVRKLAQFVKTGPMPQYDTVPMMKKENCQWSKRINKLKQQIYLKKLHANKSKKDMSNAMCIEIEDQKTDNQWISDETLTQNIRDYTDLNGLYNSNPIITIHDSKNEICITNKVSGADLLQTFVIKKHRTKALIGELGVRAKKYISKGTVIGQYTGTEYLAEEFGEIYSECMQYHTRNMYKLETNVFVSENEKMKTVKMVIDGFDDRKQNQLMYINDCREDITMGVCTKEDERYWNCSFKNVFIDGWTYAFVVARKDIKIGQELSLFYGQNYAKSVKLMDTDQVFMARVRGLIDQSILEIVGMDNAISDIYCC